MFRKILFTVLFASISTLGIIFLYNKYKPAPKKIHYHAGFLVYKDDKLQDFSGVQYISVSPCADKKEHEDKDEQLEKGHLHDQIGDVVHVEAEDARWSDLFKNLKFLTNGEVVAFVDGENLINPLASPIKSYQSIIFYFGEHDSNFKPDKKYVSVERIKEVEKKSVECGSD